MDNLILLADVSLHDFVGCEGRCMVACDFCRCFEECDHFDSDSDSESEDKCSCRCVCTSHFECRFFCKHSGLCPMVQCKNYLVCRNSMPMYIYRNNDGICSSCIVFSVSMKREGPREECPICYNNESTLLTSCNHAFCYECYISWCSGNNTCPMCRSEI